MALVCKKCGLPDDFCACGELDKEDARITFACGGTLKNGFIMLQGDHRDDVKGYLVKMGFNLEAIEVQ